MVSLISQTSSLDHNRCTAFLWNPLREAVFPVKRREEAALDERGAGSVNEELTRSTLAALPDLDGLIDASTDDVRMRPMKVDGRAEMRVRVQPLLTPLVRHIPHSDRLVVTGREEVLPAGVPRQTAHPVVVAGQREQALARGHIPHADGLVT